MPQYPDGSTAVRNGITYVRTGGQWVPQGVAVPTTTGSLGGPRTLVVGPPDPNRTATLHNTEAQTGHTGAETSEVTARLPYVAPLAAADVRERQARASLAESQAEERRRQMASQPPPEQAQQARALGIQEVLDQIREARATMANREGTLPTTGFVGGQLLPNLGGTAAHNLSAQLQSLRANSVLTQLQNLRAGSSTGSTGIGRLTNYEAQLLSNSISNLDQSQDTHTLSSHLDDLEQHFRILNAIQAGQNPYDAQVQQQFGIEHGWLDPSHAPPGTPATGNQRPPTPPAVAPGSPPPPPAPPAPPAGGNPLAPVTPQLGGQDGYSVEPDPTLAGLNQHIAGMIRAGRSAEEVRSYATRAGLPRDVPIQNLDQWVRHIHDHPDFNGPIPVNVERHAVPLSDFRAGLNAEGQTAPGAAIIGAADAITGGRLDNIGGMLGQNPDLIRAGISGVQAQHPVASTLGNIGGTALLSTLGEGALGAIAPRLGAAGIVAPRAMGADVATGAWQGSGNDDENPLNGMVMGGLGGVLGGIGGRAVGRGVSNAVGGFGTAATDYLNSRGVPMTMARMIGGVPARIEDRLSSMPVLGSLIQGQARRSVRGFNRATFDEAMQPLTGVMDASGNPIANTAGNAVADQGVQTFNNSVNAAYSPLDSVSVRADPPFLPHLTSAIDSLEAIPEHGAGAAATVGDMLWPDRATSYFRNGELPGRNMQAITQNIAQLREHYLNSPNVNPVIGQRISGALDDVEGAVTGMFERQAPDIMPQLRAANTAYRNMRLVTDAVNRAHGQGGIFMPSQLQGSILKNARYLGGPVNIAAGTAPFSRLANSAQEVLPSKYPDSGTAGRLALMGLFGLGGGAGGVGAGYLDGHDAGSAAIGGGKGLGAGIGLGTLLLAPSYIARPLIQKALLSRPPLLRDLGSEVQSLPLPWGAAGISGALPYALPANN